LNKALLDTDIYSEILKAINQTVTRNATAYRLAMGCLSLSVITVMEIIQGLQKVGASPKRIQAFRTAILPEEILPFDQGAADLAGLIAGNLDRVGRPIGRCDPMIAAVAIRNGLELVTGNTAHYQRIQQLGYSITLVNWRT
jgi:tRNA(fMet)-specific endonuclease VapC